MFHVQVFYICLFNTYLFYPFYISMDIDIILLRLVRANSNQYGKFYSVPNSIAVSSNFAFSSAVMYGRRGDIGISWPQHRLEKRSTSLITHILLTGDLHTVSDLGAYDTFILGFAFHFGFSTCDPRWTPSGLLFVEWDDGLAITR